MECMTSIEVKLSGGKTKIKEGMMLYCPSHGPGKVSSIEKKTILGEQLTFCQLEFKKDSIKLSIPANKMKELGVRTIITRESAEKILESVLNKPAKCAKGIWTKRMQEYEMKLNSGSAIFIAEVVRDLFAGMNDPNKSYGERVLFDNAFECLVQEIAIALECTIEEANKKISDILHANVKASRSNLAIESAEKMDADFSDGDFDDNDIERESVEEEEDEKQKIA